MKIVCKYSIYLPINKTNNTELWDHCEFHRRKVFFPLIQKLTALKKSAQMPNFCTILNRLQGFFHPPYFWILTPKDNSSKLRLSMKHYKMSQKCETNLGLSVMFFILSLNLEESSSILLCTMQIYAMYSDDQKCSTY